jgi:hypothetical protein
MCEGFLFSYFFFFFFLTCCEGAFFFWILGFFLVLYSVELFVTISRGAFSF